MKIVAINLISSNCEKSALEYSKLLGFSVIMVAKNHSEIGEDDGIRIYFSPNSINCKVDPGSFTISGRPSSAFLASSFFQLEQSFPEKNYQSFLDIDGNRIWFYWN